MLLQAAGLFVVAASDGFEGWLLGVVTMGAGTALVYPVLIAAAGDTATVHASRIGSYRLWRDLGFVAGAPLIGQAADRLGTDTALVLLGAITAASAAIAFTGMRPPGPDASERLPG